MEPPSVKPFDTLSFVAVDSDEALPRSTLSESLSVDKPPNEKSAESEEKLDEPNPNLKSPLAKVASVKVPPNFRPAEVESTELVPNLKLELESVLLD